MTNKEEVINYLLECISYNYLDLDCWCEEELEVVRQGLELLKVVESYYENRNK